MTRKPLDLPDIIVDGLSVSLDDGSLVRLSPSPKRVITAKGLTMRPDVVMRLKHRYIGQLPIHSGRVVMCSPTEFGSTEFGLPLHMEVPSGEHEAWSINAETETEFRVAFCVVRFSPQLPVDTRPAKFTRSRHSVAPGKIATCVTDLGVVAVMDAGQIDAFKETLEDYDKSDHMINVCCDQCESQGSAIVTPVPGGTFACWTPGLGDGAYDALWLLDTQSKPCMLIIDGGLVGPAAVPGSPPGKSFDFVLDKSAPSPRPKR
jgi:hypothetical protein